jgi:hypothetical protein
MKPSYAPATWLNPSPCLLTATCERRRQQWRGVAVHRWGAGVEQLGVTEWRNYCRDRADFERLREQAVRRDDEGTNFIFAPPVSVAFSSPTVLPDAFALGTFLSLPFSLLPFSAYVVFFGPSSVLIKCMCNTHHWYRRCEALPGGLHQQRHPDPGDGSEEASHVGPGLGTHGEGLCRERSRPRVGRPLYCH